MRIGRIGLISFACALCAAAQDKITVPLSSPSQPVTIKVTLISGNITVTGGGSEVIVAGTDRDGSRRNNRRDSAPPGMVRINPRPGMNIEEDHNVITISGQGGADGDIAIQTPVNTNLQLRSVNGSAIEVTGVNGDLDIDSTNGTVTLNNVSGSVVAHALNGGVVASLDRVTAGKPMAFTSLNGKIDVTIPADTKARFKLKSDNGAIYSDFDVKLEADANKPVVEDSRNQGGKYRIRVDHSVTGTINGGGPDYTFQTMNGNILIHKK
jgi:DUF4097 and DUF4098 domain-containing protein YvlB